MSASTNSFSWSFSRHETFQSCLKRYYFSYYGAWGGWAPDAPATTRELYLLKRLSTRQQWAGRHTHQAIEFLLKTARNDSDGAPAATAGPRQIDLMRREFRESRAGLYRQNPARVPALFEHEYHLDLPPEEWKSTVDRVAEAIGNFLRSDIWQFLRSLPEDAVLSVEQRAHVVLDGLSVFAVPDLVVRDGGRIRIYDWKTSRTPPAQHRMQVGIYGLLASQEWEADPAAIEAMVYNPREETRATFAFHAEEMETLREFIRDSAEEMLFPMENPEQNDPGDGSNFDCTADRETCKTCSFLRVCPRWIG